MHTRLTLLLSITGMLIPGLLVGFHPAEGRNGVEHSTSGAGASAEEFMIASVPSVTSVVNQDEDDPRLDWWREARFGMFIHWGLYAIPAGVWEDREVPGVGEWIMHHGRIKPREYEVLINQFNPVDFDADEWVAVLKVAGMKYLVITTKHHDGFALFDSAVSEYDIMATPFARDIMREIVDACRREGIRIGWYHSILDWHHPDYLPRRPWDDRPADDADFARYVEYLKHQVREIMTNYGPIDIMWFDGEWEDTWTHETGVELYDMCLAINPDVIINNRVDKGRQGMAGLTRDGEFRGDFGTPEQEIPATGLSGIDWETCMTMNDSWGFKTNDDNWKSTKALTRHLIDIASKGGNFLLNVGPDARGRIPEASVERLRGMGEWLRINGEAIYGTQASPFHRFDWGRCTMREVRDDDDGDGAVRHHLYLHIFDWPANQALVVPGLKTRVRDVYFLDADRPLPRDVIPPRTLLYFQRSIEGTHELVIDVAEPLDHDIATVIVVELEGRADVQPHLIRERRSAVELTAADAHTTGGLGFERRSPRGNLGYWTRADAEASWEILITRAGRFTVEVVQACPDDSSGTPYRFNIGDASLDGRVQPTGGWSHFETVALGEVELPVGTLSASIRATEPPSHAVMNLERIILRRVE